MCATNRHTLHVDLQHAALVICYLFTAGGQQTHTDRTDCLPALSYIIHPPLLPEEVLRSPHSIFLSRSTDSTDYRLWKSTMMANNPYFIHRVWSRRFRRLCSDVRRYYSYLVTSHLWLPDATQVRFRPTGCCWHVRLRLMRLHCGATEQPGTSEAHNTNERLINYLPLTYQHLECWSTVHTWFNWQTASDSLREFNENQTDIPFVRLKRCTVFSHVLLYI